MTVTVDSRRNALIVVAPESLFLEVKMLVTQLDLATPELRETISIGEISRSNPGMIQDALSAIVGEAVRATSDTMKRDASAGGNLRQPGQLSPQQAREQYQQRMEFIKMMQRAEKQGATAKQGASKSGISKARVQRAK